VAIVGQMALAFLAWLLFSVVLAIVIVCPFYRQTRKGLLTLHWSFVNLYVSEQCQRHPPIDPADFCDVLLASATLLLLLDRAQTKTPQEYELSYVECVATLSVAAFTDTICSFAFVELRYVFRLCLFVGLLLSAVYVVFAIPRVSFSTMNVKALELIGHESFFFDDRYPLGPLNCLGRFGIINFCCVITRLLLQLSPTFAQRSMVVYTLYVASAISSVLFLCIPAHVGGLVQVVKRSAFYAVQMRKEWTTTATSNAKNSTEDLGEESGEHYYIENVV
jgi:hypothetical protein